MQLKCRKKKICVLYGEGVVTDRMCQKWFVKFHAWDFWLDDAPRLDRPVEVDGDQTETLIKNNQRYSVTPHGRQLAYSKYPSQ